jgi:hypothetical protein
MENMKFVADYPMGKDFGQRFGLMVDNDGMKLMFLKYMETT